MAQNRFFLNHGRCASLGALFASDIFNLSGSFWKSNTPAHGEKGASLPIVAEVTSQIQSALLNSTTYLRAYRFCEVAELS
jgi:hypothetical protein